MSDSIDRTTDPVPTDTTAPAATGDTPSPDATIEVDEQTPDGGRLNGGHVVGPADAAAAATAPAAPGIGPGETDADRAAEPAAPADDDEPAPELVWYVLKVQSGREDTIRDALQKRVKIQGLQRFF